jgi:serine/threonine protein kinase
MLTPGTVLQNRYRIASPLGQGGMGAVYRAWDMRLNIPVAVKEMVPQPGIDPHTLAQLRQQFYQEAQVLARLNHPNLVRVTDYFEEGGNAYLVMDFVEGQSLADLIAARGPLPEAQVLDWARQLLDALAYCHAQGVVHRDIKPQNIIIRPDGRPVLVDFGLVKLWDPRDPRTRTVVRAMGTPEYAPPEQWGAGHTDPRSDLYSLGATLYHALTGQAPATATDRFAEPGILTPPCSITPSLRPETERAILRAMELAKDARWGSAAEMAAALGLPAAPAPVAKPAQPQPTRVINEPPPQPIQGIAETPSQAIQVITEAPPPATPTRPRISIVTGWWAGWRRRQPICKGESVGWKIWLGWVALTTISVAIGYVLADYIIRTVPIYFRGEPVIRASYDIIVGTMLGVGQWLVLRPYFRRAGWWILCNSLGLCLNGIISGFIWYFLNARGWNSASWDALSELVSRSPVGLMQWLFLRKCAPRSGGWIIITAVSWAMAWILNGIWSYDKGWLAAGAMVGATVGVITGSVLVMIMPTRPQDSGKEEVKVDNE